MGGVSEWAWQGRSGLQAALSTDPLLPPPTIYLIFSQLATHPFPQQTQLCQYPKPSFPVNPHPPVAASMRPNICGAVMALGFMRQMACLVPSSVRAAARHSMMVDLPEPAGPTTMMPWRTCRQAGRGRGCVGDAKGMLGQWQKVRAETQHAAAPSREGLPACAPRTRYVSYSWMHLLSQEGCACSPRSATTCNMPSVGVSWSTQQTLRRMQ